MDHLPRFFYQTEPYPEIPYLCREPYDGGDFQTYPQRQGWSITELASSDFRQGRSTEQTASFLQNWLYFGLLNEICRQGGAKFDVSAFTKPKSQHPTLDAEPDREKLVSTVKLEEFVSKSARKLQREIKISSQPRLRRNLQDKLRSLWETIPQQPVQRLNACLDQVRKTSEELYRDAECPLSPEIITSIKILGQMIDYALRGITLVDSQRDWGIQEIATTRLRNATWCPREIALARRTFSSISLYCASFIQRLPNKHNPECNDHSKCSEVLCEANHVNEKSYRKRHVVDGCSCKLWGPGLPQVVDRLREGCIPMIGIKSTRRRQDGSREVECRLVKRTEGCIISHVWADGLGNPDGNQIHLCQLEYIRDCLLDNPGHVTAARAAYQAEGWSHDGLRHKEGQKWRKWNYTGTGQRRRHISHHIFNKEMLFWIDTLCIPAAEGHEAWRSEAIRKLPHVYAVGKTVLVFDLELLQLEHKRCSSAEIQLRIALSSWMRRCWTFQEAVIAGGKLHVQFKDGAYDIAEQLARIRGGNQMGHVLKKDIRDDHPYRKATKVASGVGWLSSRAASLALLGSAIYEIGNAGNPVGFGLGVFNFLTEGGSNDPSVYADEILEVPKGVLSISDRFTHEVKLFFAGIAKMWAWDQKPESQKYDKDRINRIVYSWEGLQHRATSHESDRFVNFAFACAPTEQDLLKHSKILQLPKDQRFRAWLDRQPVLPAGLLFTKGPRILEKGYRWAPHTIMPVSIGDSTVVRRPLLNENVPVSKEKNHILWHLGQPKQQKTEHLYKGPFEVVKEGFLLQATTEQIRNAVSQHGPGSPCLHVHELGGSAQLTLFEDSGIDRDALHQDALQWEGSPAALVLMAWPTEDIAQPGVLLYEVEEVDDVVKGTYATQVLVKESKRAEQESAELETLRGVRRSDKQVWAVS